MSDLAWLGTKDYDSESGKGAIGVEFAGTAVTSTGRAGPIEPNAGNYSRGMVKRNDEMMWQEGYYRGYFRLAVTTEQVTAQFYGTFKSYYRKYRLISNTICRLTQRCYAEFLGPAPRELHGRVRGQPPGQAHRGRPGRVRCPEA